MNKFLVTVRVPNIEAEYEIYIPNNKKMGTVKNYILKVIAELSQNIFVKSLDQVRFIDRATGAIYKNDMYVKDSGIKNGSIIVIVWGGEMMDLKINYQETISVGNQVQSKGSEFQELLSKVRTVNSELQTYWQGSDASKYSNAVSEQTEYMQQLSNTINEIGEFLVKVGQAYQEASENNANAIR